MGQAIKCPACGRLVSGDFHACPFCQAPIPRDVAAGAEPAPSEPIKCTACGRLAAASFTECPFCSAPLIAARDGATAPGRPITVPPSAIPGASPARVRLPAHESSRREGDDGDDDGDDLPSAAAWLVAGGVLLVGAGVGCWSYVHYDTLSTSGQGLGRTAFLAALAAGIFVSPQLLRRYEDESLAATAARIGWARVLFACAAVSLVFAIAGALTLYGALMIVNAQGMEARAQGVRCTAPSVERIAARGRSSAPDYRVSYACELPGRGEARGELRLPFEPRIRSGGTMTMTATRGRLGVWLRWGGIVAGSERGGRPAIDDATE